MTKKNFNWPLAIFALALALRLAYLFFLKQNYFFYDHPSSDVDYYRQWAKEIAGGNWLGDRAFFGLPLYPYFLAVIERLCLGNIFAVQIIHLALGSLNCALLFWLAQKIFPLPAAVLAGVLAATNFTLIYYDWLLMPVTLVISLTLLILYSLIDKSVLTRKRHWTILGILIGLATTGDGKFLIFFALTCLYLLISEKKRWQDRLRKTVLPMLLGIIVVIVPVTVRNRIIGGDWILISAQSGLSFYAGNNADADGIYEHPAFMRPDHSGQDEDQKIFAEQVLGKNLKAGQISAFWKQQAMNFITRQPGNYLKLLGEKFLLFFTETEKADELDMILQRDWKRTLDLNPYSLLCPLAILGGILAWRRSRQNGFINLLILCQLIVTVMFFLTSRHRSAIVPLLILYEAYFFWWIGEEIRQRRFQKILLSCGFLVVFVFLFRPQTLDPMTIDFVRHAKAGPIYAERKDFQRAEEEYMLALRTHPFDTNTLYNLGNVYLLSENYKQAQDMYLKVLRICHFHVDALFNLGYIYEQNGVPALALQSYQEVLKYAPESLDAHFRIAGIFLKAGDCENAKSHFDAIAQTKPILQGEISKLLSSCTPAASVK